MTTAVATETRVCRVCGIEYPLEQMGLGKVINGKQYRSWSCVSCETARKVKRPVPYQGEARTCAHDGCTTTLSRYNHGLYCAPHEHLLNELAQPDTETTRKEVIRVSGVTLTPAKLPPRNTIKGIDWDAVIDEFIATEEECCQVEAKGRGGKPMSSKNLYATIRPVLVRRKETRVDVVNREERAYLVRRHKK